MDNVWIGMIASHPVRIYGCDTTHLTEEIMEWHQASPLVKHALGRTLAVGAMMGAMMKDDSKLTIKVNGNGPMGMILVDATSKGQLRGFVSHPEVGWKASEDPHMSVGSAVGHNGFLTVVKNLGLKQNYSTQVRLQTGEIGDDFSFYFDKSEQTPSVVSVGVKLSKEYKVEHAGGWIIQLLPGATEEDFDWANRLIQEWPPVTSMVKTYKSVEKGLLALLPDLTILEHRPLAAYCTCSTDRFVASIATLPEKDIHEMIADHGCEITCDFCGKKYHLSESDLNKSLAIKQEPKE